MRTLAAFAAIVPALLFFLAPDDLAHNRLIQATLSNESAALPMNLFQKYFSARVNEADAAQVDADLLRGGRCA